MASPEAGPLRMMVTLGIAGLCSGLAVVGIYLVTKPRIERNRAEALEAAIFRVLDGARTREAWVLRGGALVRYEGEKHSIPTEEAVYAGYDENGVLVGHAIPAEGAGFQDIIKLIYGYRVATSRIIGMEVLESRETPGLGDKIIKDDAFLANFHELAVDPQVVLVKGDRSAENEVESISGATISSRAIVRIINESNARWLGRLKENASQARQQAPDEGRGRLAHGGAD